MGWLHDAGVAEIYERDVALLNLLLDAMGQRGMPISLDKRVEAAATLEADRVAAMAEIQRLVPPECCPTKLYATQRPNAEAVITTVPVPYCTYCCARRPNRKHTCWKTTDPSYDVRDETQTKWRLRLPFVPSPKGLLAYFRLKGYTIPSKYDRATGERRETTDEAALLRLALRTEDPLLAAVLRYRGVDKELSTYVGRPVKGGVEGGLIAGPDSLVRTVFTHDPSTLRLASKAPALMNLPREGVVRRCFEAPPGYTFWACDFAGIENIIVGWLARSERYVRLSKLDMHSFYTAYAKYELEQAIPYADLPQEGWSDDQLRAALKAIKTRWPADRQANKKQIHGGNYMEGPGMVQEQILKDSGVVVPLRQLKRLQAFYFELFPEIRTWQRRVVGLSDDGPPLEPWEGAYQKGYLRTPFGNIHRYYDVLTHVRGPKGWELRPSTDAKRAVAFVPQSCGRFVLTRAAQRLPLRTQDTLRLFIHDEMLGLAPDAEVAHCVQDATAAMTAPIPELGGLSLPVEAKTGRVWGEMR